MILLGGCAILAHHAGVLPHLSLLGKFTALTGVVMIMISVYPKGEERLPHDFGP